MHLKCEKRELLSISWNQIAEQTKRNENIVWIQNTCYRSTKFVFFTHVRHCLDTQPFVLLFLLYKFKSTTTRSCLGVNRMVFSTQWSMKWFRVEPQHDPNRRRKKKTRILSKCFLENMFVEYQRSDYIDPTSFRCLHFFSRRREAKNILMNTFQLSDHSLAGNLNINNARLYVNDQNAFL